MIYRTHISAQVSLTFRQILHQGGLLSVKKAFEATPVTNSSKSAQFMAGFVKKKERNNQENVSL
jgi:hypothetical protein